MYIIYNYFNNFDMLKLQVENWNKIVEPVTIVLVDDHSQVHATPAMRDLKKDYILYRMSTPAFHGAAEARNTGVMATIKPGQSEWVFLSDMDIVLTPENVSKIFTKPLNTKKYYKFARVNTKGKIIKTHMNTFVLNSDIFWKVNGYDADYVGTYGGDREFLDRVRASGAAEDMFTDISVILYDENDIFDANCKYDKALYGQKFRKLYAEKARNNNLKSVNPIRRKFEIVATNKQLTQVI